MFSPGRDMQTSGLSHAEVTTEGSGEDYSSKEEIPTLGGVVPTP